MKRVALILGPVAAVVLGGVGVSQGLEPGAAWTLGVGVLCAVWWITEPVPIPVTALVPVALLPAVGVLSADQVGAAYGGEMILLLLGGFLLSTSLERCGVHRRLALGMVRLCSLGFRASASTSDAANTGDTANGGQVGPTVSGRRLVLGFMIAAAVISAWVSNAATTLMLLPIAIATLERAGEGRLRVALLLGIAYAASIGGVATPVGTPPNLICLQHYESAAGAPASFLEWMTFGAPVALAMLPLAAWWLTRGLRGPAPVDLPQPGAWRTAEVRTLAVFATTALLWVFRTEPLGGWTGLVELPHVTDATVSLAAVIALFLIPSGEPAATPRGLAPRLLDWETAARIPWGMLLLFSGGMVLAEGFAESGLSDLLGQRLEGLATLPAPLLVALLCLATVFLSEFTSNTAITALLMPIMASMAGATGLDPKLLMFPTAMAASLAFMLPAGTVPNAVVYGAGGVSSATMAREGFVLNLMGVAVVTLLATLFL
ncbi:MAG: SLC13 family permease [Lacipirellulaceae bacterium]